MDEYKSEAERIYENSKKMNRNSENKKNYIYDKKSGKLTKASGIILVIFFSIYVIVHAITTIGGWIDGRIFGRGEIVLNAIVKVIFGGIIGEIGAGILTYILGFAYVITLIVFAGNLIADSKKQLAKYLKSTGAMITYLCFYFAWLVVPVGILVELPTETTSINALPIALLSFAVVLGSIIMVVVDLLKAKEEFKEMGGVVTQQEYQKSTELPTNNENSEIERIKKELDKIELMKKQNIITEEEYKAMRSKVLNK